jgi:hypothetical protein
VITDLVTRWTWTGQPVDALVLNAPLHDGATPEIARHVFHRLVVRFASIRAFKRQWFAMWLAFLFVLGGTTQVSSNTAMTVAVLGPFRSLLLIPVALASGNPRDVLGWLIALVLFVVLTVALPVLMTGVVTPDDREEAVEICRRVFLRDIPAGTPPDLCDVWRQGWLTSDGRPISSELCEADARTLAARERAVWWIPSLAAFSLAIGSLFGTEIELEGCLFLIIVLMLAKLVFDKHPGKQRSQELNAQAGVEGAAFAEAGGMAWARPFEDARKRQISEAIREAQSDPRPCLVIGRSSGVLAARGDFFAPTENLPFSMSLRDLETHMLVLGGTGSGKTSGVLRPLARQIGDWANTGMVVMDGKGALPSELTSIAGMRLIDPARERISLVAGLDPVTIADTIVNVFTKGSEKADRFFIDSAAILLRHSATVAQAAGGRWWTLSGIEQISSQDTALTSALQLVPDDALDSNPSLVEAIIFMKDVWAGMEERVKSNICAQARSWVATITGAPDLLRWAETEEKDETAKIDLALRGGRIGVLIPAHRYGRAAAAVTALLKARLFAGIKARADRGLLTGETPVVFLIDEAQEVATDEDATMLAIGRSLRLSVVAATQTVEGVVERLGPQVSQKWLGIFGALVALPGRSPQTDVFVSQRCGMSWRPSIQQLNGMPVRTAIVAEMVSGALAAGKNQRTVTQFSDVPKLGAPGLPKWMHTVAQTWQNLRAGMPQDGAKAPPGSVLGVRAIVEAGEISSLLADPDTALAIITRARVLRRDVIRLSPLYT